MLRRPLAESTGVANPGRRDGTGLDPKLETQGALLSHDTWQASDLPADSGGPYGGKAAIAAFYSVKGAGLFDTDDLDPRPPESLSNTTDKKNHPRVGLGRLGPDLISKEFDDLKMTETGTLGDDSAREATKIGAANAALARYGVTSWH